MSLSLPKIEPYALPTAGELPVSRVDWRLDAGRAALLVHDMQRYFMRPFAGAPIPEMTANIAALAAACREQGVPSTTTRTWVTSSRNCPPVPRTRC